MSGHPSPEGVRELSEYLRVLTEAQENIARLDEVIRINQAAVKEAHAIRQGAIKSIKRLMDSMDVDAPGNFGYEGRMLWLLLALNSEAEQFGRRGCTSALSGHRED